MSPTSTPSRLCLAQHFDDQGEPINGWDKGCAPTVEETKAFIEHDAQGNFVREIDVPLTAEETLITQCYANHYDAKGGAIPNQPCWHTLRAGKSLVEQAQWDAAALAARRVQQKLEEEQYAKVQAEQARVQAAEQKREAERQARARAVEAQWQARAAQQKIEQERAAVAQERAQQQSIAWMAIPNCRNLPGCMAAHGADQLLSPGDTDFNPYYACARYHKWCQ
jgi:hypothetical protein